MFIVIGKPMKVLTILKPSVTLSEPLKNFTD